MKRFARWLYMKTHRQELLELAHKVRNTDYQNLPPAKGLQVCGELQGTLDTLEKLDLLV